MDWPWRLADLCRSGDEPQVAMLSEALVHGGKIGVLHVPDFGGNAWVARVQELARVVGAEDLVAFQVGPVAQFDGRTLVPIGSLRGGRPFGSEDVYCASLCTIAQLWEIAGPMVKRGRAGVVTMADRKTGMGRLSLDPLKTVILSASEGSRAGETLDNPKHLPDP